VGVIGLGRIGQKVVQRLSGFDCRILAVEPKPDEEFCRTYAVELLPFETVLAEADVVTIHVPLSESTRHMIANPQLSLMKPSAVIINTSRGGVIDEPDLVDALVAGRLAAAGLDVFEHEPLAPEHPLVALENVVLSGHAASFSRLSISRITSAVSANVLEAR